MIFDRLTWMGFMVVALGWAFLFSAPQLAELLASFNGRSMNAGRVDNCFMHDLQWIRNGYPWRIADRF
jgi:hypothetical protein